MYDPDAQNPYGFEVARLLRDTGLHVELWAPRNFELDADWVAHFLPDNNGSSRLRKAKQYLVSCLKLAGLAFSDNTTIVVNWCLGTLDAVTLALLSRRLRVIAVLHNPARRTWPLRAHDVGSRLVQWTADVLIVHDERLARIATVDHESERIRIARHPLYSYPGLRSQGGPTFTILLLGEPRSNKIEMLSTAWTAIPAELWGAIRIIAVGKGWNSSHFDGAQLNQCEIVGGSRFATHCEVAEAIGRADLLLAPYSGVTASGSVMAAVSAGLPVLAFDHPALREIVPQENLVPYGASDLMAAKLIYMVSMRHEAGQVDVIDRKRWRLLAMQEWRRAISPDTGCKTCLEPQRGATPQ